MYTPESIDLLRAHGIDFQRHEDMGIDPNHFAELMITSGLVLTDETKWISFHRCAAYCSSCSDPKLTRADGPLLISGYDFGYFIKLLTAVSLPTNEDAFFDILRIWFPTVYDVKFMMRACKQLKGGLQDVADDLGVSPTRHLILLLILIFRRLSHKGATDWVFASSRVRLALDRVYLLQDAGDILQRPRRRHGVQR